MTEALPSPKGRHFVIVFDYSESIQVGSLLSLARKVGKVLLSLINSNDKVSLLRKLQSAYPEMWIKIVQRLV